MVADGVAQLFHGPVWTPVTFPVKVHVAPPNRLAPDMLTDPDPGVAVIIPPLHVVLAPAATASPAGNISVKPTPANAVAGFGFVIIRVMLVLVFRGMLAEPNALVMVGGAGDPPVTGVTVMLAIAAPPVP